MVVREDDQRNQIKQYSAEVHQRNDLRRKLFQGRSPRIGVFFFANGELFADPVPIRYGYYVKGCQVFKVVRDVVNVTLKHAEFETSIIRAMMQNTRSSKKFADLLRGRVAYDRKKRKYIVMADKAIVGNDSMRAEIVADFSLPDQRTIFKMAEF